MQNNDSATLKILKKTQYLHAIMKIMESS